MSGIRCLHCGRLIEDCICPKCTDIDIEKIENIIRNKLRYKDDHKDLNYKIRKFIEEL